MSDEGKTLGCQTPESRKEWNRPLLKKLPIAATASSGKGGFGDEGGCGGKGDSGACRS